MRVTFILATCLAGLFLLAACEEKPKTAPPEWEVRYGKARAEADAAFAASRVSQAAELYRVAADVLPAGDPRKVECEQKLAISRFLDLKEKATQFLAQGKQAEALLAIEAAKKLLPPTDPRIAEIDGLLKTFRYRAALAAGQEKMAKKSWLEAAKDFEAAAGLAPDGKAGEAKDLQEFCGRFAGAEETFLVKKDFRAARPLYEELLKAPHGFEKDISARIQAASEAIAAAEDMAKAEKKRQFGEALGRGKDLLAKAEWAKAKEALEGAKAFGLSTPEYEELLKLAQKAADPPDGFVFVPAGKFPFGAGPASGPTGPEQEAATAAYYIQKREVTNGDYRKFLESAKDHSKCLESEPADKKAKGHGPEGWSDGLDPQKPVTGVDWFDAWAYARWAGGRLPSEVEWEKAAGWNPATGKKTVYPWGDEFSQGKGGPSPCGAEAMGSGILEWVDDWYLPYQGGAATDVDLGRTRRVARGGVFLSEDEKEDAKVTRRFRFLPDRRDRLLGFRIVKPVE